MVNSPRGPQLTLLVNCHPNGGTWDHVSYIQICDAACELHDEEGSLDIARGFLAQRTRDTGFGAYGTRNTPRAVNGSKQYDYSRGE